MKIYVQNLKTNKYYAGGDHWTANPQRAVPFPNAVAALNFCQTIETSMPGAQLMMRFHAPDGKLWLAVTEGKTSRETIAALASSAS